MGAIWYQFDWTLFKEPHLLDVEIAYFSFSSGTFLNRYLLLFSQKGNISGLVRRRTVAGGGGGC